VSLRSLSACAVAAFGVAACAPRVRPLTGNRVVRALPATSLERGHRLIVFKWILEDRDSHTRGEGAVRQAGPDSARLDFFLGGGLGSGAAALIRDELRIPVGAEKVAGIFMPPLPMLWAIVGRAAPPALPDTVLRMDGDTLRVDIGRPMSWRLTFARDTLRRVEHVDGKRVVEWVSRYADGRVRYRHQSTRRQLDVTITKSEPTKLDATIWNP